MNEEPNDSLPVRENGRNPVITRDVNEDRLLKMSEENVALKRHLRKQEDRIRQLATKLVRVVGERSKRTQRDDILLEDQKTRIGELEAHVSHLRGKLNVARQQLGSYTKLVPGSTSHGRPKSSRSATGTPTGKLVVPDQVTRLLLDAKGENHLLKDQVGHLQERWNKTNQELMTLKEQLKLKEVEYQDELMAVRSQAELESESKQKKIAENIQFIRLQRDSKRTASWLATYEAQCRTLEANLNSTTENVSQLELQLSMVQEELRNEQAKSLGLLKLNEESASCVHQLEETNAQLEAIKVENRILKEANEACLKKSLESCDRIRQTESRENNLNSRIQHLESTVKNELKAKSELISALTQEKAKCLSLEQTLQLQERKYTALSAQVSSAKDEIAKYRAAIEASSKPEIMVEKEFIVKPCESCPLKDTESIQLHNRADKLKTEIVKIKELLKTQISINKEYQEEIEALTSQLANVEVLHERERQELMEVFSDKTSKMAELEQSLETLRQSRAAEIPPPQAFIPYDVLPLVQREAENVNLELVLPEEKEEIGPAATTPLPSAGCSKNDPPVIPEADELDKRNDPLTLSIDMQQFVPINSEILPRLFLTWEHDDLPRQYSPIVSDGIFQAESVHQLGDGYQPSPILVQLHQAIGTFDARTLASGSMELGVMQSTSMKSIDSGEEIGRLFYSCTLSNWKFGNESNNNGQSPIPEIPHPPPVPIPRKLKSMPSLPVLTEIPPIDKELTPIAEITTTSEEFEDGSHRPEPAGPLNSSTEFSSDGKVEQGKRKSILRRETSPNSPRSDKRRVRVSDNIEERKIDSDSDGQAVESVAEFSPEEHNSDSAGQIQPRGEADSTAEPNLADVSVGSSGGERHEQLDSISETTTLMESEVSEKRRARRLSRRSEEWDEVSTTLSVGSEGETSRNISDIETISEDPSQAYPDCEMTIEVIYAKFHKHSHILSDPHVKKFFVEYQFLNYPAEELETESSLPKPQPGRKAQFDFKKFFFIDTKEKRRLLKEMLLSNKKLRFTLVTEPGDNDTIDCEDIGYAYVSLTEILNSGNDISRKEIPVYDSENANIEIGSLSISVIAFKTLNAL